MLLLKNRSKWDASKSAIKVGTEKRVELSKVTLSNDDNLKQNKNYTFDKNNIK